jgi:hypothetical protein
MRLTMRGPPIPAAVDGLPARYAFVWNRAVREGEACSRWSEIAGKHFTDSTLTAIDCGGGWDCMCYCK